MMSALPALSLLALAPFVPTAQDESRDLQTADRPGLAQPADVEPEPASPELGDLSVSLRLHPRLTFRTDIKGADADALVSHNGATIEFRQRVTERLSYSASLGFEASVYDFDGGEPLPGVTDPFDDLYSLGGIVTLHYAITREWSVFGAGFLGFAWESGADIEDALLGGGGVGVGWRPSENFHISVGVGVRSRLEDSAVVTPLVNISWQFADDWRLATYDLPQGGGFGLTRRLNQEHELTLFGGLEFRQWRLDDDGDLPDAVVRDLRVPVGLAWRWTPNPAFTLELEGGAIVYQEYEFFDDSGDRIADLESDPAPFLGLRIDFLF